MKALAKLVEGIGYAEGLPVVVNPGILDPGEFIDTVLKIRIPNPFMPDTPQRIATDTSQKLAIRYGGDDQGLRPHPRASCGGSETDSSGLCRMAALSYGSG